jgi:hypothetical protein
MNNLLSRLTPAVALCLPLLAIAQAGRPDPADPKAAAPALHYPSAFADYKPWQDTKPADWRAVNATVRDTAAKGGGHAGHAMPANPSASAPAAASKAAAPAMPGHGGHHQHGGKP